MSRTDFLDNLRVARSLYANGRVTTDGRHLDPAELTRALARAAIWLTPSAVKGFRADDFRELGAAQQHALTDAVLEFERVAATVPTDEPATEQQFGEGSAALEKILTILDRYFPSHEEAAEVRAALGSVDFPPWVINWVYEIGNDQVGDPAVWVRLYADEKVIPPDQLGRCVSDMIPKLRSALKAAGIRRWPYVSLRTAREHKAA